MPISLGSISFDDAYTTVREQYEEVGGRDARHVEISGIVTGASSAEDIEARLDAILDAASQETFETALSLRTGRRLFVRRTKFLREIARNKLTGAFTLTLEAQDPFEESITATSIDWTIAASGPTLPVSAKGNAPSSPIISLKAVGQIVAPQFSDGTRTLVYGGSVADGKTLVLDAVERKALLDSNDVTAYTNGVFPEIRPEGTVLTYSDDDASSHTASVNIAFRDRWW